MHDDIHFSFTLERLGYGSEPIDRPSSQAPEHRLMRAVLEDAVHMVQKYAQMPGRRAQRLFRESQAWLWSNDDVWPFSAVNICEALGMDVDYLRRGLAAALKKPQETYTRARREHGRNSRMKVRNMPEVEGHREWVKMRRAA